MNRGEKPVGNEPTPDSQEADTDISDAAAVASRSESDSNPSAGAHAKAHERALVQARTGLTTTPIEPLGVVPVNERTAMERRAQAPVESLKRTLRFDGYVTADAFGAELAAAAARADRTTSLDPNASSTAITKSGIASDQKPPVNQTSHIQQRSRQPTSPSVRLPQVAVNPARSAVPDFAAEIEPDPTPGGELRALDTHPPRRSLWKRVLLATSILILLGCAGTVAAVVLTVKRFEVGLPSAKQLRHPYRPPQVTRIWSRQEKNERRLLSEVFTERRTVVPFSAVPNVTKYAFLAAEDAYFYEHQGLSYLGMLRAMLKNVRAGHVVQGGSTITQQVVKNLYLESKRNYARKIQETILARRLEQSLSKDEIFELYLNLVYLGHGRYGIEEAARGYFNKSVSELDLVESSILAGIVHSPERYSPYSNSRQRTLERQAVILKRMVDKHFITEAEKKEALAKEPHFAPKSDSDKASDVSPEMVSVAKQILAKAAPDQAALGGFDVSTTIDPELQKHARSAVTANLRAYAAKYGLNPPYSEKSGKLWGPLATAAPRRHSAAVGRVIALDDATRTLDIRVGDLVGQVRLDHEKWWFEKEQSPSTVATVGARIRVVLEGDPTDPKPLMRLDTVPQSALVAIDVRTREVLALVGGREATPGGLDRATQTRRQPGSAFKPFVYSYALSSKKFTAASLLTLPPTPKRPLATQLTLRDALARSENDAAIQLLEASGPAEVVAFAQQCGIESKLAPTPSLALGAYEVSLLELTNAYATFASGGISAPPVFVTRISRANGSSVELPRTAEAKRVMTPELAYLATSLMRGVVEHGTAQRAKSLGRSVVGKTGTTNRAKDTWFVGYSPEIVVGVWVGFDDPISLGSSETGANTALPAWIEFMKAALAERPKADFPRPPGIVVERIDPATGFWADPDQANAIDEEFLPDTGPSRESPDAGAPAPVASSAEDPGEASRGQPAQAGAAPTLEEP